MPHSLRSAVALACFGLSSTVSFALSPSAAPASGQVTFAGTPLATSAESRKFTINPPGLVNISVGCDGVTDGGSSFTSDRDNTGTNNEAYTITARDGLGNLIHSFSNSVPVPVTAALGNFTWNAGPALANPITVRFESDAGNGLPRQLVFEITGTCSTLPFPVSAAAPVPVMSPWGLAGLGLAFAGLAAGWLRTRRGRG